MKSTYQKSQIRKNIEKSLKDRFVRIYPSKTLSGMYVKKLEDNLIKGIDKSSFIDDIEQGDGKELNDKFPKFNSIASSSALVVNTFAPWKNNINHLAISGNTGFMNLTFEKKIPNGLNGYNPNMDVFLEHKKSIWTIESKFLEPFDQKQADFKEAYVSITDFRTQSSWFKEIIRLNQDKNAYTCLDATQLLKHAMGLLHTYPNQKATLIYLFWEPFNWQNHSIFICHRNEIEDFAVKVSDDPFLGFMAISYIDLWDQLKKSANDKEAKRYIELLEERYLLNIE